MIDALEPRRLCATTGLDPTYGTNGRASIPLSGTAADYPSVLSADFTPSGAAYLLLSEPAGRTGKGDRLSQVSVVRFTPDGTFDTAFGTNGRAVVGSPRTVGDQPTIVASRTGRLAISDRYGITLLAADGKPLTGANKRLRSFQDGVQVSSNIAAAFDDVGHIYIAALFQKSSDSLTAGVARYTSDGRLDTAWADDGLAGVFDTDNAIQSSPKIALSADGHIAATFERSSFGGDPDDVFDVASSETLALLLAPDGTRLGVPSIADYTASFGTGTASTTTYDLRALADGTFAAATDDSRFTTSGDLALVRLLPDGTASIEDGPDVQPYDIRLLPSGGVFVDPSFTNDADFAAYFPAIGRSDDAGFTRVFEALGDGRLMDADTGGVENARTLVVRRFDGTNRYTHATSGKAAVRSDTRTLDVAGTSGRDTISVRYRAGKVNVRINNANVGTFSIRDFDTLTVHGDAGDDAIDVRMAGVPRAIRVLGGAGRDTILADHPDATLDGGADNDYLRGPGYLNGGSGDDRLDGVGLLRGGPGDDVLLTHRRGVVVPAADG